MKPTVLFGFVVQMAVAMATGNLTSSVPDTTLCMTTTIYTTITVTLTAPKPSDNFTVSAIITNSGSKPIPWVVTTFVSSTAEPVEPTVNATHSIPASTIVLTITDDPAPFPTSNGTLSSFETTATLNVTGTGSPTTAHTTAPPEFTAGQGKMIVDKLAFALVAVGGAALQL